MIKFIVNRIVDRNMTFVGRYQALLPLNRSYLACGKGRGLLARVHDESYKRIGVGIAHAITRFFACELSLADILFLALSIV